MAIEGGLLLPTPRWVLSEIALSNGYIRVARQPRELPRTAWPRLCENQVYELSEAT